MSGLRKFLATVSPLKIIKNTFYFFLKPLFVLKIFNFLSYLFGHVEKRLLFSKFMKLQPSKQTTAIHILPNISRSKGNQTMKFSQIVEQNMRKLFFKIYT